MNESDLTTALIISSSDEFDEREPEAHYSHYGQRGAVDLYLQSDGYDVR